MSLAFALDKPSLTTEDLKGLVSLPSKLPSHPPTRSTDNVPRNGLLSLYREDGPVVSQHDTWSRFGRNGIGPHSQRIPFGRN